MDTTNDLPLDPHSPEAAVIGIEKIRCLAGSALPCTKYLFLSNLDGGVAPSPFSTHCKIARSTFSKERRGTLAGQLMRRASLNLERLEVAVQDQLCVKIQVDLWIATQPGARRTREGRKAFLPPAFSHIAANCVDSRQPTSAIGIGVNKNAYSLTIKLREQRLC